jgi:cytochrome c peroxidase
VTTVVEPLLHGSDHGNVPDPAQQRLVISQGVLMSRFGVRQLGWFVFVFILVFMVVSYVVSASSKVEVNAEAVKLFAPLPAVMESPANPVTDAKVTLGRMLYYEPRLSASQQIACNTCHGLDAYGAEQKPVSTGHKGQKGKRNAPTVYNAAGHFAQFWDGRAPTVEEQAKGPILNPIEMAMPSNVAAVQVVKSMPEYVALFQTAFPNDKDPVTYDNVGRAIGAFERKLVTPSRWDGFLEGKQSTLTDAEKAGFNTFAATGCQYCHYGAYVGGASFQKLGVVKPWADQNDEGLYQLTKDENDKMVFKVPSLRNIKKTGPYFHDGSVATLEQAIRNMALHQRGVNLTDAQVKSIAVWMDSLTGPLPSTYIKEPVLPKSTAETPRPSVD